MSTRVALVIAVLFFQKKICKGKRCQCGDFQMAIKKCRMNNHDKVAQKLKEMKDIHFTETKLSQRKTLQRVRKLY